MKLLRRLFLSVVAATALAATPMVAFAASDEPPVPATGTTVQNTVIHFNASTVSYIIAVLIPIVGGLAIRYIKSNNGKVAVMVVLNGLNALFTTATTEGGDAVISGALINNFIQSTVISIATLYGFYKAVEFKGATIDARLKGEVV